MTVLVLGAGGQLGSDLIATGSGRDVMGLTHSDLDLTEFDQTRKTLAEVEPTAVINTAAFHQVDACEEQVEKAFEVNAFAVLNLARVCAEMELPLLHVSTDYVFGGPRTTPWAEEDAPNPLSVYGVSKLAGEHFVLNASSKNILVRSAGLYGVKGASGKGGNFVETMIRVAKEGKQIRVVDDQVLSPTYTHDFAEKIWTLVDGGHAGIFHVTNAGACSWFEFAGKVFSLLRLDPDIGPTTTEAYGLPAPRPEYSVLGNFALEKAGVEPLRSWDRALEAYLVEKGHVVEERV